MSCIIIRNAHQVYSVPGYFHFYVIVAGISKLNLPCYVFVIFPIGYPWQICRNFDLRKVIDIIQALTGLLIEKPVRQISKILMQCQFAAYIKQVDGKHRCGNQLFQCLRDQFGFLKMRFKSKLSKFIFKNSAENELLNY